MRDILLTLFIVGSLPVAVARPFYGILLWTWVSLMSPHRLTWGFAYDMSFAMMIAAATFIGMAFNSDRQRFPVQPLTVTWLVFVAYMGVTTLFAFYPEDAFTQLDKVWKIQLVALLTLLFVNSREKLRLFVWVVVVSIGFFGVKGGLFTARGGGGLVFGPSGSFIGGNNELALAVLVVVPLMRALQLHEKNKYVRWGLGVAMILCVFAAAGSHSRGALVAGAATMLFFWWKSPRKMVTGIAAVLVSAIVLMSMPAEWWSRMQTIETFQQDESAQGRINAWATSLAIANDNFFGGGFECWSRAVYERYRPGYDKYLDVHSIYFEVLGEHGWVALGLFLLIFLLAWKTGNRVIALCRDKPDMAFFADLARMSQVSLIAYLSGGAFLGLAYFDLPYNIIGILVLCRVLVERELGLVPEQVLANRRRVLNIERRVGT
jgi:probable O-glycosylation ligase (exosortase A-associated)